MSLDSTVRASVLGISIEYKPLSSGTADYLPQHVAVFGQGATAATYATTKFTATSASQVGDRCGFGSPIHLAAKALFPENGDGLGTIPCTFYPLDDHGSGVAATGDITPSGTAAKTTTYWVRCGGVLSQPFTIAAGSITVTTVVDAMVAAVNAVRDMPVVASDNDTDMILTSKWKGTSANDIVLEVLGGDGNGVAFAFTPMASGATDPDITTATNQVGSVWQTMVLNCGSIDNSTALDALQSWGEGRWGATVHAPCVVFTGNTAAALADADDVPVGRADDYVNAQLVAPGSPNLPCVVAARQLARIAKIANNNPPTKYTGQRCTGLIAGTDAQQWDYSTRDAALKLGSSTVTVADGVVIIGDVVTFYHPSSDVEHPVPNYVVDVVRIQNVIYNLRLTFEAPEYAAAPMLPAGQSTVNPLAKTMDVIQATAAGIIDELANAAILSDPDTAKSALSLAIDGSNPKRFNLGMPVALSGNTSVKDITVQYGFYLG